MNHSNNKIVLNGPRPSPLKVNKDSHVIQKQKAGLVNQPARKPPVIIYTHSPKIIHTKPKDFMALVQKLTGFTRPEDDDQDHKSVNDNRDQDNDSSSVSSGDDNATSEVSPAVVQKSSAHQFMTDFPLFTPNSTNNLFASSPSNQFRYTDLVLSTPSSVNLSPSFVEFMKGLPEY